jgi:hypothetical protein
MSAPPIPCVWHAKECCFYPRAGFMGKADAAYADSEIVVLAPIEQRSSQAHSHYFAVLNELWANLPHEISEQFVTSEHLRKRALIMTGWRDETSLVLPSKAEALKVAAWSRQLLDEHAVISVSGTTVVRLVAKSQSLRAMGKADFTKSKADVLGWIEDLIGIDRGAAA